MQVKARGKDNRVSARKVRLLANVVRGKMVSEALVLLQFMPSPLSKVVAKVVKSAAANAENNFQMAPSDLRVVGIFVDEAPTMKRLRLMARGRANRIFKRSSHITVIVAEQED